MYTLVLSKNSGPALGYSEFTLGAKREEYTLLPDPKVCVCEGGEGARFR